MALGCLTDALQVCRQKVQGDVGKGFFFGLVGLVVLNQLVSLYQDGLVMTKGHTLLRPVPARFHLHHALPKPSDYVSSLAQIRRATLISGVEVRRDRKEVAVGMLVVGTADGLIRGMRRQLESLLTFSSGADLHLILVTDLKSQSFVAEKLAGIVAR